MVRCSQMHAIDLFDRYHLTVDDVHKMGEVGIILPDSRVELIEGEIINMAPIGSGHTGAVDHLVSVIGKNLSENATMRVQNPIILGSHSEVQPDLAIV